MAAIQLNFSLRTSSGCKTVHLLGSWDNYAGQLPLSKDPKKSGGWLGCFKFQGATLKQGQRYWYYVRPLFSALLNPRLTTTVHHRRLPRVARPRQRPHHRAHHRPQTQHPRHPRQDLQDQLIIAPQLLPLLGHKPRTAPRKHPVHPQRPLRLALQDRRPKAQPPLPNPRSHPNPVRQGDSGRPLLALRTPHHQPCRLRNIHLGRRVRL